MTWQAAVGHEAPGAHDLGEVLRKESCADRSLDHVVLGTPVAGRDGLFGVVSGVMRNAETLQLQTLWVRPTASGRELEVPVLYVEAAFPGMVRLTVSGAWLAEEAAQRPRRMLLGT